MPRGGIDATMYYAPTLAAHYATAFMPSLYNLSGPIKKATSKSRFEIEDSLDYLPTLISQIAPRPVERPRPMSTDGAPTTTTSILSEIRRAASRTA